MILDGATLVNLILIPFVVGVVIPFLTAWISAHGLPTYLETLVNAALSAATASIVNLTFNGDWKEFALAFGVAWVGALRGHYLGLAQAIYAPKKGKHEKPEQLDPTVTPD